MNFKWAEHSPGEHIAFIGGWPGSADAIGKAEVVLADGGYVIEVYCCGRSKVEQNPPRTLESSKRAAELLLREFMVEIVGNLNGLLEKTDG